MDVAFPKPGVYVVAVSGGVDSMVLLDVLRQQPDLRLVVAHFDHGIRTDSHEDRQLVQAAAAKYGLPFVYDEGHLGSDVSEAKAREARYDFLRKVVQKSGAAAIITAHHQDDLLETAIINMLRGSGRKGLTSLGSTEEVARPLLDVPKSEIRDYAKQHKLKWHEDATNTDEAYLRNYVRRQLLTKFDAQAKAKMLDIIKSQQKTNLEIDEILKQTLRQQPDTNSLDRRWFNQLSHDIAKEVMADWLRLNGIRGFDAKTIERLVIAAKTGAAGKVFPVMGGYIMSVDKQILALSKSER